MRLLIVDHEVLFREGIASLLESTHELSVVGQADTLSQAMQLIPQAKPDVILIELDLPDGNGLEATQKILSYWPDANVVILSTHHSDDFILSVIRHGAIGFIPKHMPKEHFIAAIKGIQHGEAAISRKMTRRLIYEYSRVVKISAPERERMIGALSFREVEVFRLLGAGASNREIADNLHIAENTVKSHVHKILEKLRLRSRLEARNFADRINQDNPSHIGSV